MYDRIEDLAESEKELANPELDALGKVWRERRSELEASGEFKEFLKKLQREWAIETGIIERLYTWDRGVTEVLIEQGIDSSLIAHRGGLHHDEAEHVGSMIQDQLEIIEGLLPYVKGERPLTEHFIRGLQAQFTAHQLSTEALSADGKVIQVEILRGSYKQQPNNPRRPDGDIHEYCPPELVNEEMERLVTWFRQHEQNVAPEVLSAWLHHRFTQVHPFQDGNGRVARALSSLVFLRDDLFPLVVRDADRKEYIESLEAADEGDLEPLVDLCVKREKGAILAALGLEQQVQQQKFAEEIISSAVIVLKNRFEAQEEQIKAVYEVAESLRSNAEERLEELSSSLNEAIGPLTPHSDEKYRASVRSAPNDSKQRHYFYAQIVRAANQMDYFANLDPYRSWTRLAISTDQIFEFVISFHGYGPGRSGILVASAFTFQRVPSEEQGTEFVNIRRSTPEIFQFNYAESQDSIERRFKDWLESATAIALTEWKKIIEA